MFTNHSNLSWICINCGPPNMGSSLFDSYHSLVSIEALADENSDESLLDSDCFEPRNTSTPTKATDKNTKTLKNKKSPQLETMVINCDGLKGQKSRLDFQAAVAHHTPDIIIGCESKLDATLPTYSIFSEDYNIISETRIPNWYSCLRLSVRIGHRGTSSGGGVFIAFKNSNVTVDLPDFDAPCEVVWNYMEFVRAGKLYIRSFYRPPSDSIESMNRVFDGVATVIGANKNKHENILLCRDFNMPDVDWGTLQPKSDSKRKKIHNDFLDLLAESGLVQLNKLITITRSNNVST